MHKDFKGSTSIKYVLPVLATVSYDDLDIKEGGTAAESWNKITSGLVGDAEAKKISDDLIKYCGRDTYAMYAIWKHLSLLV